MQQGGVIAGGNGCQTPLLPIQLLALRAPGISLCFGAFGPSVLPDWPAQLTKVLCLLVGETSQCSFGGDRDADGFL